MQVCVIASSSAGNCTVVWDEGWALLIDCGLTPSRTLYALARLGLRFTDLAGVLVTHTHGDHLHRGMFGILAREGVPLLCPVRVAEAIEGQLGSREKVPEIRPLYRTSFEVGKVAGEWFAVPHDAVGGCCGFVLRGARGRTLVLSTDIGTAEQTLPGHLAQADLLVIESNHDLGLLLNSDRPAWLKQRIRDRGHLSNDECGELLRRTLLTPGSRLERVVLAHLSQECNTERLAVDCARRALDSAGREDVVLCAAGVEKPTPVFVV